MTKNGALRKLREIRNSTSSPKIKRLAHRVSTYIERDLIEEAYWLDPYHPMRTREEQEIILIVNRWAASRLKEILKERLDDDPVFLARVIYCHFDQRKERRP